MLNGNFIDHWRITDEPFCLSQRLPCRHPLAIFMDVDSSKSLQIAAAQKRRPREPHWGI
jgi:hypothetical protein